MPGVRGKCYARRRRPPPRTLRLQRRTPPWTHLDVFRQMLPLVGALAVHGPRIAISLSSPSSRCLLCPMTVSAARNGIALVTTWIPSPRYGPRSADLEQSAFRPSSFFLTANENLVPASQVTRRCSALSRSIASCDFSYFITRTSTLFVGLAVSFRGTRIEDDVGRTSLGARPSRPYHFCNSDPADDWIHNSDSWSAWCCYVALAATAEAAAQNAGR